MLRFLPDPVKGTLASLFVILNTLFWCVLIYPLALVKLISNAGLRQAISSLMATLAQNWISGNSFVLMLIQRVEWDVRGMESLDPNRSYLVLANHQSWVDIVVLQHLLNRRIPFLRFFLKQELIWVPLLGLAWWALDFPFMRRYSKEYLSKHPEKRGEDLRATRRACEKLAGLKISVLNFAEGTRFSEAKRTKQNSPFQHLLRPKAGGIAFVLDAMGAQFKSVVDITIIYPDRVPSFWDLLSGRLGKVRFLVKEIEIPKELLNRAYLEDTGKRLRAQDWVHNIWQEKDAQFGRGL